MSEVEILQGFAQLEADLIRSGYHHTSPTSELYHIDHTVATSTPCPSCKGRMEFVPLCRMDRGRSYRSFAYCRVCDTAVEF